MIAHIDDMIKELKFTTLTANSADLGCPAPTSLLTLTLSNSTSSYHHGHTAGATLNQGPSNFYSGFDFIVYLYKICLFFMLNLVCFHYFGSSSSKFYFNFIGNIKFVYFILKNNIFYHFNPPQLIKIN